MPAPGHAVPAVTADDVSFAADDFTRPKVPDVATCLHPDREMEDGIISIDASRVQLDFRGQETLDLSSREKEFEEINKQIALQRAAVEEAEAAAA